jgi:hypothetical protein
MLHRRLIRGVACVMMAASTALAQARGGIKGREPVAGAEVSAVGVNSHLVTDSLGRFLVPHLWPGTLILRLRKMVRSLMRRGS